jgi:glutathione synthase/RimK-type ligase-like ATP-grasp enzyme
LEDQEKELFAQSKSGLLDVNTTMHLLDDYSIPVPQTTLCTTVEQAQAFATAFSFPVVLKLT